MDTSSSTMPSWAIFIVIFAAIASIVALALAGTAFSKNGGGGSGSGREISPATGFEGELVTADKDGTVWNRTAATLNTEGQLTLRGSAPLIHFTPPENLLNKSSDENAEAVEGATLFYDNGLLHVKLEGQEESEILVTVPPPVSGPPGPGFVYADLSGTFETELSVNFEGGSLNTPLLKVNGLDYPSVDGTAGQVIATDGAGGMSFTTLASAPPPVEIITADGPLTQSSATTMFQSSSVITANLLDNPLTASGSTKRLVLDGATPGATIILTEGSVILTSSVPEISVIFNGISWVAANVSPNQYTMIPTVRNEQILGISPSFARSMATDGAGTVLIAGDPGATATQGGFQTFRWGYAFGWEGRLVESVAWQDPTFTTTTVGWGTHLAVSRDGSVVVVCPSSVTPAVTTQLLVGAVFVRQSDNQYVPATTPLLYRVPGQASLIGSTFITSVAISDDGATITISDNTGGGHITTFLSSDILSWAQIGTPINQITAAVALNFDGTVMISSNPGGGVDQNGILYVFTKQTPQSTAYGTPFEFTAPVAVTYLGSRLWLNSDASRVVLYSNSDTPTGSEGLGQIGVFALAAGFGQETTVVQEAKLFGNRPRVNDQAFRAGAVNRDGTYILAGYDDFSTDAIVYGRSENGSWNIVHLYENTTIGAYGVVGAVRDDGKIVTIAEPETLPNGAIVTFGTPPAT